MHTILVVDDDRETCRFITELIAADDRRIVSEQDPAAALRRLRQERVDLMVSDINLNASQTGLDLLRAFKVEHPGGQVLLISGFGTLETAIEAVRAWRLRLHQQAVQHRRDQGHGDARAGACAGERSAGQVEDATVRPSSPRPPG